MATDEPRFYDAHDVMASERRAKPETAELPPLDPRELEVKYLVGISFPAARGDVVAAARANDAPARVLEFLEGVADREYRDVGDLAGEIEDASGGRREVAAAAGKTDAETTVVAEPPEEAEEPASPALPQAAAVLDTPPVQAARRNPLWVAGVGLGFLALGVLALRLVRRR